MTHGREKRLLLGLLAWLAPLPLPLNEVLSWPLLVTYLAVVTAFLHRAWRDPGAWLPGWALNVLGLAYLPVLYIDLLSFWGGQMIRPVLHLAMFAVAVKLFALRHEKDKWQVLLGIFFLFLTAMGTSVHPTVVVYLVAMVGLGLALLARFACWSVLARFGYRQRVPGPLPLRGFLWAGVTLALLLAAPLFALLPRVRTPYITPSRGGGLVQASGFSDTVSLDSIGSVRENRQVVLRLDYQPDAGAGEPRFKGATYEGYSDRVWLRSGEGEDLSRRGGNWVVASGRPEREVEIWLEPLRSSTLPLPVEALEIELRVPRVSRDAGGGVKLGGSPAETVNYRVRLDDQVRLTADTPDLGSAVEPTLDLEGLTPRMAVLAAEVMGAGEPFERVRRLERYFTEQFGYTTESIGRLGEDPLETFLFDTRRGHCELFASAMTLMLRSEGIPARLVTGFLGAERNAFEGYYVVRQSNAHAWVEAWVPGIGWRLFDPTPPAGRPGSGDQGLQMLAQQAYDFLIFRWDRYVLSYGAEDQAGLFLSLRNGWMRFWRRWQPSEDQGLPGGEEEVAAATTGAEGAGAAVDRRRWLDLAMAAVIVGAALVLLVAWWRRRVPRTAIEAFTRLRHQLEGDGGGVREATPPLEVERALARKVPAAAEASHALVALYLRESFGGEQLADDDRERLRECWREVEEGLQRAS